MTTYKIMTISPSIRRVLTNLKTFERELASPVLVFESEDPLIVLNLGPRSSPSVNRGQNWIQGWQNSEGTSHRYYFITLFCFLSVSFQRLRPSYQGLGLRTVLTALILRLVSWHFKRWYASFSSCRDLKREWTFHTHFLTSWESHSFLEFPFTIVFFYNTFRKPNSFPFWEWSEFCKRTKLFYCYRNL